MSYPLIQRVQRSVPTAASTDISMPRVKPGQVWRVTHLALSDDAAGDITAQFGVTDIAGFHPLIDKQLVQTGDVGWNLVELLFGEEDLLTCRVTTTTGAGQVTFIAAGEILARDTGVAVIEVKNAG